MRCPDDETGRNSVSPWTTPSTSACVYVISLDDSHSSIVKSRQAMPKTAGIILVGNEILSGKVVDANAAHLCRELRELGVDVRRITVIPDEVTIIAAEVRAFSAEFDIVFTSGGVGPTHDDVTVEGVARAMGVPVVRHPTLVALLERYYGGAPT